MAPLSITAAQVIGSKQVSLGTLRDVLQPVHCREQRLPFRAPLISLDIHSAVVPDGLHLWLSRPGSTLHRTMVRTSGPTDWDKFSPSFVHAEKPSSIRQAVGLLDGLTSIVNGYAPLSLGSRSGLTGTSHGG
jgi:hypothetical protein